MILSTTRRRASGSSSTAFGRGSEEEGSESPLSPNSGSTPLGAFRAPPENGREIHPTGPGGARVAQELGRTPTPDQYDETRRKLIEADRLRNRDEAVLADLLPTSGQILALAGTLGWDGACKLAGVEPPTPAAKVIAVDPVKLAEHFYETKRRLPTHGELYAHGEELGVPIPRFKISKVRADLIAARGLATPPDGPEPGTEPSADELEQLLAGVTKRRRAGSWTTDRVLEALAAYASEYGPEVPLRQKHYVAVRAQHGWPSNDVIRRTAKTLNLAGFQDMLEEAERRARKEGGALPDAA